MAEQHPQAHTVDLADNGELALMNHGDDRYTLSVRVTGVAIIVHLTGDDVKGLRDATGMVVLDNLVDALRPAA